MPESKGAYGNTTSDTSFRKTWDKEEYEKKAKEKDRMEKERMQENEKLIKQGRFAEPKVGGRRPRIRAKEDLPKPTQLMRQREGPLELDKNLNQTMVVSNPGGRGAGQPGFYCELCSRNYRDTIGYLDHINSRAHLRRLGQTTNVERSTLEQVRERIAALREETRDRSSAKTFDFEKRLEDIRMQEEEKRRVKKAERMLSTSLGTIPDIDPEVLSSMGFGGFASSKQN